MIIIGSLLALFFYGKKAYEEPIETVCRFSDWRRR